MGAGDGSSMIGWVEIDDINRRAGSAELRVCIGDKRLWGRGYGTEAVRLALEAGFQRLKLREVYLRVAVDNERAVRAYRKCGFSVEGILRAGRHAAIGMRDHFLMTLRRPRNAADAL
ncbi:MAG: GNAT family N-acetyltransferase [Dactylosporangium sp.]|nr:GNAT family N-acetyltransferase [Dactylosporangium sp.]